MPLMLYKWEGFHFYFYFFPISFHLKVSTLPFHLGVSRYLNFFQGYWESHFILFLKVCSTCHLWNLFYHILTQAPSIMMKSCLRKLQKVIRLCYTWQLLMATLENISYQQSEMKKVDNWSKVNSSSLGGTTRNHLKEWSKNTEKTKSFLLNVFIIINYYLFMFINCMF